MAVRIRVEHGQEAGKTYRLPAPGRYRFGRTPQSSIQILDMKVSKEHFEILVGNGGVENGLAIHDLDSSHGTLLNGQRVVAKLRPLVPGDEIRVGLTVLRVLSDGPADADVKATGPAPTAAELNGAAGGAPTAVTASGTHPAATSTASSNALSGSGGLSASGATRLAAKDAPPDPLAGLTLGGYKIIERVGAGGMGSVYRAEQLSLHREVALKVLAQKLVTDSAFVDQFVNEARAAGALNHPNVVQVYDVGTAEGRPYFSMEFIHGGSIEDRIPKTGGGLPWQEALSWFLDAANALVFAEKKGILHRDIKPDNLMLSQDGSAKLCDLGLAKKSESADLLQQGIIGTPHFISPEAIRRRADVDHRSDLYSLGCTFYRILTGKNPYSAGSVKEILLNHLNAPVPRVSALISGVPKELDEVVSRLMQKDAGARYQNATELWEALDKIRLQHGLEAHGMHPGRAKKIALAASLLAVAGIGAAVYFVFIKEKEVVTKEGERVEVVRTDPAAVESAAQATAETAFTRISSQDLRAGDLKATWANDAWAGIAKQYAEYAADPKFAGRRENEQAKPWAEQAAERAKEIETFRKSMRDKTTAFQLSSTLHHQKLETELKGLEEAVAKDLAAQAFFEAAGRVRTFETTRYDTLTAAVHEKTPIFADSEKKDAQERVTALYGKVDEAAKADLDAVVHAAAPDGVSGDLARMAQAKKRYDDWLEKTKGWEGAGPDVGRLKETFEGLRSKAKTARDGYGQQLTDAAKTFRLEDNRLAHETIRKFFAWIDAGGPGGFFPTYRVATEDASGALKSLEGNMKTPEGKAWAATIATSVGNTQGLFTHLAHEYVAKAWTDRISDAGNDWSGPLEGIQAEGVKVAGKLHLFREQPLTWLKTSTILYDAKGNERFALTADDHEGLGMLCAAGVIAGDKPAKDGDKTARELAEEEWKKALDLDKSEDRAKRIDRWRGWLVEEDVARKLLDDAWTAVQSLKKDMDVWEPRTQPEFKEKDKNEAKGLADAWRKQVASARSAMDDLEKKHGTSFVWAVLSETPPVGVDYVKR